MEEVKNPYEVKRRNFMKVYEGNTILSKTIPAVAAQLLYDEFGINVPDPSHIAIVFKEGWSAVGKFVHDQQSNEFSVDIGGITLEYVTEYSESDKPCNIVPQMTHKRTPIFTKQDHQIVPGSSYNDELLSMYNSWRTVNLSETIGKLERDIFAYVLQEYGINMMVAETIFPMMAAAYVAGLQIARETKDTVNMYNMFEIDVADGDKVMLTALASLKQWVKNDTKQVL